jgi:uncharacterized membrane protein
MNLYTLISVILLLGCFIPIIIWFFFGKELRIDYKAEYERDTPTDDPPAIVNAICGPGFSKNIGEPDMDGFKATIMDLINRKYLLIIDKADTEEEDTEDYSKVSLIYLKVNPDKNDSNLKIFENDVINFLKKFDYHGFISLDMICEDLTKENTAKLFRESYHHWKNDIQNKVLTDDVLKKIFDKKGDIYEDIFGVLGLIIAIIIFITAAIYLPDVSLILYSSIIFGMVAIGALTIPQRIEGHWTTNGEEYDAKWHNFKKYIHNSKLIKEYPPESIEIWNKYLIYATALGIEEPVLKAMEQYIPKEQLENSDVYMFNYYGGYDLLKRSIDVGMHTINFSIRETGFGGVV